MKNNKNIIQNKNYGNPKIIKNINVDEAKYYFS